MRPHTVIGTVYDGSMRMAAPEMSLHFDTLLEMVTWISCNGSTRMAVPGVCGHSRLRPNMAILTICDGF